jgi:phasin family protein
VKSVAKGAQRAAETAQDGVRTRLATATEAAQRSTDHVVQLFGLSGKQTQDTAAQAVDRMQVAAHASTALIRGFQEVSREWFGMTQKRTQLNLEALTGLAQCRSFPELIAAQAALLRDNAELTLENSRRLTELSVGVVDDATRTASKPTGERAGRAA